MTNTQTPSVDKEELQRILSSKTFLGAEYLIWLWYRIETGAESLINDCKGSDVTSHINDIWIDDKIVFESSSGASRSSTLRGGLPSKSTEAQVCLAAGKRIRELKLGINIDPFGDFVATVRSDNLAPSGIRLPKPQVQTTPEESADSPITESAIERVELLQHFFKVSESIVTTFIADRLSDEWDQTIAPRIKAWKEDRASQLEVLH